MNAMYDNWDLFFAFVFDLFLENVAWLACESELKNWVFIKQIKNDFEWNFFGLLTSSSLTYE